jgi:ATP-dependent DNA helicase DinG
MSLINHFPKEFSPRPSQIDLINRIDAAFEEYDVVICQAPTGTGKSFLSKTLANASKDLDPSYIRAVEDYSIFSSTHDEVYGNRGLAALTITKALQDQYTSLFDDAEELKGKTNYVCQVDPNVDVDTGPCVYLPKIKKDCWSKNICPYYNQRNKSLTAKFAVYNYNMFLSLPDHLKAKEYLVCDEASEIEDQLVKHFSISLSKSAFKFLGLNVDMPNITNYNIFHKWLADFDNILSEKISEMSQLMSSNKKTDRDINRYKALSRLNEKVKLVINSWATCEYVIDKVDDVVNVVPLYISSLSSEIFKHGKKILLMSATIVDPQNFAKTLGIERYKFIEAASTFDPAKSPIYISSKYTLNYQNLKENLPKIVKLIQEICAEHEDDKGVIHTHTGFINNFLKNNLKGDRFIFRHEDINNEVLIADHIQANFPSVIVSPSITHGVDLKDDLARFQIIVKLPYMPLGDTRIKKLFDEDPSWYTNKMLCSLVQASGRGVRSQSDWCNTYILDGGAINAIKRSKSKLPKFFLDRIQ